MNIRSKNSTYFSKNNDNYLSTNHQFTQDAEDCNSVHSQDERQLDKGKGDAAEGNLAGHGRKPEDAPA